MTVQTTTDTLRAAGFRLTPQRLAILQVLQDADGHLCAADIFARAGQKVPGMTEATVYRTLDFLVAHGMAFIAHIGSGRIVYETAENQHHHLICHKCGGSVAVTQSDLQPIYDHLEHSTGFRLDSSHVTFFGLCPGCKSDPNAS